MNNQTTQFLTLKQTLLYQAGSLNFDLSNNADTAQQSPVIYITDDATYNQLVLTISNQTGSDIPLNHVDLSKDDPGNLPPPLYLTVDGLSNDEVERIKVTKGTLSGKDITLNSAISYDPDGNPLGINITPTADTILQNGQTLAINLNNVTATEEEQGDGGLHVYSYYNDSPGPDHNFTIAIQYPTTPEQKTLLDDLDFTLYDGTDGDYQPGHNNHKDWIYICGSETTCTNDLDDNTLILSMVNKAGADITQSDKSYITLSFPTSNSDSMGTLCTPDTLGSIEPHVGQEVTDGAWDQNTDTVGSVPVFKFNPTNKSDAPFGTTTNAATHFILDKIKSNMPIGETIMYIAWYNIPGYNDGITSVSVTKEEALPTIKKFQLSINPYTAYTAPYQKQAYFEYAMYGAAKWQLDIKQSNATGTPLEYTPALACSKNGGYTNPNIPPGTYTATLTPES